MNALDNVFFKSIPTSQPTAPKRTERTLFHDVIDLDAGANARGETCFLFDASHWDLVRLRPLGFGETASALSALGAVGLA